MNQFQREFSVLFPMAPEKSLPGNVSQIRRFLKERIALEISEGVFSVRSQLVRILSHVSPPRNDVAQMAQYAVNCVIDLKTQRDDLNSALERIAKVSGFKQDATNKTSIDRLVEHIANLKKSQDSKK